MSRKIEIVEVGLRDGLQNEKTVVPVEIRIESARRLALAGIRRLEIGAFVRPDKVPQMVGSKEVTLKSLELQKAKKIPAAVQFSALVPNEKGMQEALETGVREVAVFASATESFSQANINCSIEESFQRFAPVMKLAKKNKIKVRGYLSMCFGCPFEGKVPEKKVVQLAKRMHEMGCFEISIGDTIGAADPRQVANLFQKLKKAVPTRKLAAHFHDTRGTALANALMAYQVGIRVFDTSLGGLGGCPYAPGSAGNVSTEDIVYMFERMGIETGIDLPQYIEINHWFSEATEIQLSSKVGKAGLPKAVPLKA
jgi:hydroxymethylglutaryl-CoA lyase